MIPPENTKGITLHAQLRFQTSTALNDIITLLLHDAPSCLLPAKQSVWLISKYFKGKLYCSDWTANIPRSHSVVRPIRVIMHNQRAKMSSWGTAIHGRENTYNLQIRQGQRHQSWRTRPCLLQVLSSEATSWLISFKFPNQTTPLHYTSPVSGFETLKLFLCLPETAMLFVSFFAKLLQCSNKRDGFSLVCVSSNCGAWEWFEMKGMVLNVMWLLSDKAIEAPSCTLEEMGKCF